jgi:hypothetical protein
MHPTICVPEPSCRRKTSPPRSCGVILHQMKSDNVRAFCTQFEMHGAPQSWSVHPCVVNELSPPRSRHRPLDRHRSVALQQGLTGSWGLHGAMFARCPRAL